MFSAFDLLGLFTAAAVILVVIPHFVFRRNTARGFVHAAFFLQAAAMVLGDWKLYLPGAAAAFYLIRCLVAAWLVRRGDRAGAASPRIIARLIHWSENRGPVLEPRMAGLRRICASPAGAAVALVAGAIALRSAWFALHNVRLLRLESYSRTLSLHTLMRGDLWDHDPSVALLAPIAWLSGLAPDQAIRFSGALAGAALIAAMAYAGWRRLGQASGAVTSSAIFAGLLIALNLVPAEPTGAEWSAIFAILAVGFAGKSWGLDALSILTAALIHLGLSPILLVAALALTLASLLPAIVGRMPAFAALAVLLVAIFLTPRGAAPEHQYEAAARAAHRIAREFRSNDWILVSPGLEVAQTYGRGWHLELADFVNAHSERQVAGAGFRFPYTAQNLFVFIAKRVLNQPAFSFAHDAGAAPPA